MRVQHFFYWLIISVACLCSPILTIAQQIDISLHETAVPDSFEVRVVSDGATYTGLTFATFSIRWEASAGGAIDNSDIGDGCADYALTNYGGIVDILDHRYFPIVLEPKWPSAGCVIDTVSRSLGGVRIRELNGCRNVEIVSDAFTWVNNLSYWISVAAMELTGAVTSGPISSGDCPPCEPPQILDISASAMPTCLNYPLDLAVEATGTTLSYSWTAPNDTMPFQYLPAFTIPTNPHSTIPNVQSGLYQVEVSNLCGTAIAEIEVMPDSAMCVPPVIDSAWYSPPSPYNHLLRVSVQGTCATNTWSTSSGAQGNSGINPWFNIPGPVDYFMVISSNECGADTAFVNVDPDEWCIPPSIDSVWYTAGTGPFNLSLNANIDGTYMSHQWIFPSGNMGTSTNGSLNVPNAPTGPYTLISTNLCGSDTAWIDVTGIAPCTLPVINSISASPSVDCIQAPVLFSVSMTSPNPKTHEWFSPNGALIHTSSSSFTVPAAPPGWYVFIGTNNCGSVSDSVQVIFDTDTVGCVTPQILSITSNAPICAGDTLILEAEVIVGEGCVIYDWSGSGVIESGGPSTTAPGGTSNNYGLTISSACGTATLSIPTTIYTINNNSQALCGPTGPVDLDSLTYYSGSGGSWFLGEEPHSGIYDPAIDTSGHYLHYNDLGCLIHSMQLYEWPGVNAGIGTSVTVCSNAEPFELFSLLGGEPDTGGFWGWGLSSMNGIYDPAIYGSHTFSYVVTNNGCSHVAQIIVTEIEMTNVSRTLCSPVGPIDLDSLINTDPTIGYWTHNDLPHSGIYDPAIDVAGFYYKYNDLGCAIRRLNLIVGIDVYAGVDTSITACSTDGPIELFPLLGEGVTEGGFWFVGMSPLPDGFYYPQNYSSGNFGYQINGNGCGDQAFVTVTELQATPWYSDQDNDGVGDPAEMIMECDPPDGYVSDASDNCPLLFGLIGDECDDGLEGTINDVITTDCECVGEITTSIGRIASGNFEIWPNPNDGDRFFVRMPPDLETVSLEITDVAGRVIHRSQIRGLLAPIAIDLDRRLNAGSYFVRIGASDGSTWIERLVLAR